MGMNAGGGGIRLRPLEIGDVLDETFKVYKRQFVPLVTTMAVVTVPSVLLSLPFAFLSGTDPRSFERFFENPANVGALIGGGALFFVLWIVLIVAQLVATAACVRVASDGVLGQQTSIKEAYREALSRFGSLLLVGICTGLALGLLAITCIGFPVAIYLGLGWALVYQGIMLEGHGAIDSMRRSSDLANGHRWRLLVCALLMGVIVWLLLSVPAGLFSFAFGMIGAISGSAAVMTVMQLGNIVFQAAGQTLFGGIGFVTVTLLYYDLRVRKEAYDLQQRLPGVEIVQPYPQYPAYGQQPQYPPQYPQNPQQPQYPPYPPQNPGYPPQYPPQVPPPPNPPQQ